MERVLLIDIVSEIAGRYAQNNIGDKEQPLTFHPYNLNAIDIAAVLLDVQKELDVDLDKLFEESIDFSVSSIARAVALQAREKS